MGIINVILVARLAGIGEVGCRNGAYPPRYIYTRVVVCIGMCLRVLCVCMCSVVLCGYCVDAMWMLCDV